LIYGEGLVPVTLWYGREVAARMANSVAIMLYWFELNNYIAGQWKSIYQKKSSSFYASAIPDIS
jgi:hypothetical protein